MTTTVRAQQVHLFFRGTAEVVKLLRGSALLVDLTAAGLAIAGIVGVDGRWMPLIALALATVASGIRLYATHSRAFAERCRRLSARAYALGGDVDPAISSSLRADAPPGALRLAGRLPAGSLEEYYEAQAAPGQDRLREVYACSAFFTWRLLRVVACIAAAVGAVLFAGTFVMIYGLALQTSSPEVAAKILDALCSVVLIVLALRASEMAVSAASAATNARQIADALLLKPLPAGDPLLDLADAYDFERAGSPDIPTRIYEWWRPALESDWQQRRAALSNMTPAEAPGIV